MSLLEPLNEGVTAGLRRSSETDLFPSKAPLLIMSLNGRPSGALAATAVAETSAGGFGPESLCGSARFALAKSWLFHLHGLSSSLLFII